MKRLLDDPGDEVTRLLIQAAVDHQPPRTGKLRLMAALGMSSAFGLLSTEVFAWLSTSLGKATLAVATLGVAAGGVYSASAQRELPHTPARPVPVSVASPGVASTTPTESPQASEAPAIPPRPADKLPRRVKRSPPSRVPEQPAAPTATERDARRLGEETRWVDRLKVAAEQGDREAVQRLLTGHAEKFPEGQLQPEVDRIKNDL